MAGVVNPSSYTLKVAMSQQHNQTTDQYEQIKRAAGTGRRMSDCVPYNTHYKVSCNRLGAQSLSNYLN